MKSDMHVEKYKLEQAIAEAVEIAFENKRNEFITSNDFDERLETALQSMLGKFTLRVGWALVIMAVSGTGMWYTTMARIEQNATAIVENKVSLQEKVASRAQYVDEQLKQLREEQTRQYNTIIKLLGG